uniref:sensor histidine kinase n=1 Tax=Sphingomonas bacterium TaxID=1895847 RepID=UPI002630FA0D|nr:ATP-binding protein [Sphingomonas bacterium]
MPGASPLRWLILRIALALALIAAATAVLLALPAADGSHRIGEVATLDGTYWTLLIGGAIGLSFALWLHAATPRLWGTSWYLVSATGFALSSWATASYHLGPALTAPTRSFVAIIAANALLLFMGAFVAMFLRFPQGLVSRRAARWIIAVGGVVSLASTVPVLRALPFTIMFFGEILAVVGLVVAQAWLGRRDARIRLRLGVVAANVLLGAALYLLINLFWPRTGEATARTEILFPLNTIIFMGMGLTTAPATIFAKGGWGRSIMLSALLATAAMLIDALLLAFATQQEGAALGLAVAAVAGIYLPARTLSGRRTEQRREARARETLDLAAAVAFATSPQQVEAQWHSALRALFDPQSIEPSPDAIPGQEPHCLDGGAALWLPAFQSLSPLICRQADRGRRLFSDDDVVTVKSLIRILDQLITGRDAYLRGVEVERDRVARDLHDDVNGRLVTSLLRDDHAAMRDDVRDAICEIRTIVRAADGSNRSLANLLADLRHETATRFDAVGIALNWPAGSCPEDPVIDYLAYRHVASIVRECVTNVIRHAGAKQVRIDAHFNPDGFEIDIADDGRGAGPTPSAGNGLVNCRRRAELIGGTFHVEPRATGFAQHLAVPLAGVAVP